MSADPDHDIDLDQTRDSATPTPDSRSRHGHPRVPGQRAPRRLRRRHSRGAAWPTARSRRFIAPRRSAASRWAVKAQIHSGARGKAGGIKLCSNEDEVRQAAKTLLGQAAGDASDRARGTGGAPALRRGGRSHRAGALPRTGARPEDRAHHDRGAPAGRHGDRGDRPERARLDPARGGRAGHRHERVSGAGDRVRPRAGAGAGEPRGDDPAGCLPRLPRSRRHDGGDQSAGGDQGRPGARARLQDDLRRQRHVPPAQRQRAARLRRGGSPRGAGGGARAQLRRRSTATSAASSTVPGSPWPRWT